MTWSPQPCCEVCWIERHQTDEGLKFPHMVRYQSFKEMAENAGPCCFCGRLTFVGIFERANTDDVPYPRLEATG